MKRKYSQKKSIREVPARKSFSGEASPYWDYTKNRQRFDREGQLQEDSLANPDVLSEQDNVFNLYEDEYKPIKLQAISETLKTLSPRERQVYTYVALEGWTFKKTAHKLGLTVPTVQSYLDHLRAKVKRHYAELLGD